MSSSSRGTTTLTVSSGASAIGEQKWCARRDHFFVPVFSGHQALPRFAVGNHFIKSFIPKFLPIRKSTIIMATYVRYAAGSSIDSDVHVFLA